MKHTDSVAKEPVAKRVVITGLGAVTPLGVNVASTWAALRAGQSGIGRITHFDASQFASQVAGEVPDFDPATTGLSAKDLRRCDRFIQLGLAATREALGQAGLLDIAIEPTSVRERVAVVLGTGVGGLLAMEQACATLASEGPRRLSPFFIPAMLPNMLAGQVSIVYGLQGANVCPVSACATSAHALGWGKMLIERGEADVVVVGGAEAAVCASAIGGFAAMRALSTAFNTTPAAASRPFDQARDGFVLAEGAAVLILERASHAQARGATVLATLAGFGQTADASHMTLADGQGSARAMRMALADAGLAAVEIGYVNAHATSTPAGDALEAAGIEAVLGAGMPVSSTKGATGHLLGAAGALEAVFGVLALQDQWLPGNHNLTDPLPTVLDLLPPEGRVASGLRAVLSNSFGFGGTNASVLLTLGHAV